MHGKMAWSLSMNLLFGGPALAGPGRLKPERCSRKRGARPSRSLCSASRRTVGAVDSTHRLVRPDECSRLVGGTPTRAVETTALPIFNCIAPPEGGTPYRWHGPDGIMVSMHAQKRKGALPELTHPRSLPGGEEAFLRVLP